MLLKTWTNNQGSVTYKVFQIFFNRFAIAFSVIPWPFVEPFRWQPEAFAYVGYISPVTWNIRILFFSFGIKFRSKVEWYIGEVSDEVWISGKPSTPDSNGAGEKEGDY